MSRSKEDYLKTIYQLGGKGNLVNNKDIAKTLKISAPSVSEMIKKLLDDGYIEYTLYQGVRLTDYGIREAMKIRRRHLIWEVFLVEKLGYSWDEVDEEAEKLEHVTSAKLEERLDRYLNYPKTCPHGTPIVIDEGNNADFRTLDTLSAGEETIVRRLVDTKEILMFMDNLEINIGTKLKIIKIDPLLGKTTLRINDREISIDNKYAKNIYVD